MAIHETTIIKLRNLPESLVQEVDQFIESLMHRQPKTEKSSVSAYDLTKQWLGCAELPSDLSHNPKHMEGYGQ